MAARLLLPQPLTAAAFAPFGDVVEAGPQVRQFAINGGNTTRYHDLMRIDVADGGHPIVSLFRGQPRMLPFCVAMLERHPLGSQAFVPLNGMMARRMGMQRPPMIHPQAASTAVCRE